MSFDLNEINLIGRVGGDPKFSKDGKVLNFSVATNEAWPDKQTGEMQKRATWHHVSIFGKQVNPAYEMLRKGSRVFIKGQLTTYEYTKDNVKMYGTSINCHKFIMLDAKAANDQRTQDTEESQQPEVAANLYNPSGTVTEKSVNKPSLPGLAPFQDDEIPF